MKNLKQFARMPIVPAGPPMTALHVVLGFQGLPKLHLTFLDPSNTTFSCDVLLLMSFFIGGTEVGYYLLFCHKLAILP